jgi:hypothetical protein
VLLQLLLNSIEQSHNLIRATMLALPVMIAAMVAAAYASPIALLFTPILFSACMNSYIVFRLRRGNFVYRPDWKMMLGICGAAILACMPGRALALAWPGGPPLLVLLAVCIVVTVVYMLALILLKVVRKSELAMLKSLLLNKTI